MMASVSAAMAAVLENRARTNKLAGNRVISVAPLEIGMEL